MKGMNFLFLLSIIFFVIVNRIYTEEKLPEELKLLWEKELECSENVGCIPQLCFFDKYNNRLVIIGTSYLVKGDIKSDLGGKFLMWEINPENGEEIKKVVIKEIPPIMKRSNLIGYDIIGEGVNLLPNGDFYLVGRFDDIQQSLVKIDKNGKVTPINSVFPQTFQKIILITKVLSFFDNSFLLLGKSDMDNFMIKVDKEGNKIWEKKLSPNIGKIGGILKDGILMSNKEDFLVVGEFPREFKIFGPSDIWLVWCDNKGNILSEEIFPGRDLHLCKLASGEIVVVYDASQSDNINNRDYKFRIYNSQLKLLLESQVAKGVLIFPLNIKTISKNRFVIVGCASTLSEDNTQMIIEMYDKEGKKLYSCNRKEGIFCGSLKICGDEDRLFLVTLSEFQTIKNSNQNEKMKFKVKILCYQLK
ncbi:MAG: hypothetical protein NC827_03110 [Candidatus Omnitrophica bacterium]|nr:hypothetical protein [Candidatus Omnitrophota bacterium]MCM8802282.1 hypothetical protein [Candidatus Omnitrophota bacterium]